MGKNRSFFLKTSLLADDMDLGKPKKKSSLLEMDDFEFEDAEESSAWVKLYNGRSSAIDALDPVGEYRKAASANKKKRKSVLDEEWGTYLPQKNECESSISPDEADVEPPIIGAVARPVSNSQTQETEEEEVNDRALRIAEDFAKSANIAMFGKALCVYNGRFYSLLHDDEARRLIFIKYRSEIGQARAASVLNNAASLLKYCVKSVHEEFPVNGDIVVFENGTLEVDTGLFRKNSPMDLASSALGIKYDPNRLKMPVTKRFLETLANGDDELYELMLQTIGYILSNDIRAKSFFYLEGVGDAGKSRFCDLIASFFPVSGSNKVSRVALQDLGGKFALGNLVNARLNISEDLPDTPLTPTTVSRIKMISDANRLEAEAKYVQAFSFRPMCKLLFASNHPLRLKEYDAAFVNRVVYIPFLHAIPKDKQDKCILEKMQAELPALFNHAFEAYQRLVRNGYKWSGADRFKPEILLAASAVSADKMLILKRFVDSCCGVDETAVTSTRDLQDAYNYFCLKNRYTPIQGDRFSRELFSVLPKNVVRTKIGNQQRGFRGITIKPWSGG